MSVSKNTLLHWLRDGALFVGIVGVFLFFVHYGMNVFYPAPAYEDFCGDEQRHIIDASTTETEQACLAADGKWVAYDSPRKNAPQKITSEATTSATVTGYCDQDYYCRQTYEDERETYEKTAFFILAILGLIVTILGFSRRQSGILSISFASGGILLILITTARFWSEVGDWLQLILLFVVLIVFAYFGYRRDRDE